MEEEWEVGIWGLEESESKSRREDSKERAGGLEREGGGGKGVVWGGGTREERREWKIGRGGVKKGGREGGRYSTCT